jgi:hypothetical protein
MNNKKSRENKGKHAYDLQEAFRMFTDDELLLLKQSIVVSKVKNVEKLNFIVENLIKVIKERGI